MKIFRGKTKTRYMLRSLNNGDVFEKVDENNITYMKTDSVCDNVCTCVRLMNGKIANIPLDTPVIKIDGAFVEDYEDPCE